MTLSPDMREFCPLHGWVGRRAFQHARHDLCAVADGALVDPGDEVEVEVEVDERPDDLHTDERGALPEDPDEEADPEAADVDAEVVEVPSKAKSRRRSRASLRRAGVPPKKTLAVRRITQSELATGRAELIALGANGAYSRPKTRAECQKCPVCQLIRDGQSDGTDAVALEALEGRPPWQVRDHSVCGHRTDEFIFRSRPCVFVACKQTLYLDVSETGSIILNFPHLEPWEMPADRSCTLDLAERGAMTLEEIASVTNLTRERIRQVELRALARRARPAAIELGLGPEDAAALGLRHQVGPGADLEETGVEGAVPSDVATLLAGGRGGDED